MINLKPRVALNNSEQNHSDCFGQKKTSFIFKTWKEIDLVSRKVITVCSLEIKFELLKMTKGIGKLISQKEFVAQNVRTTAVP